MDYSKLIAEKRCAMQSIVDLAEGEGRDLTEDEAKQFDALAAEVDGLKVKAERQAKINDVANAEERAARAAEPARRTAPIGDAPAVHDKKNKKYSFIRAVNAACDGRLDGLEAEVSQEIERRSGRPCQGFYAPLGNEDPEFLQEFGIPARRGETRDLTTTTGASTIFTTEGPFIDMLLPRTVMGQLGAQVIAGNGNFAMPRQLTGSTGYYVAEGVSVTPSNPTFDQVQFQEKDLGALTNVSRKFLKQSPLDAERFIKNDQAKQISIRWDIACLTGPGTSGAPLGILNNTTIQTASAGLAIGTNGGVLTNAKAIAMETQVALANVDSRNLKYLSSPALRGYLKGTPIVAGYPVFLTAGAELNNYPLVSSTQVPANLTKGSGTNLTALVFGDWSEFLIVTFGGLDVLVNPYSNQANGGVSISTFLSMDCNVLQPAAFAMITDVAVA